MSEIQRYSTIRDQNGVVVSFGPYNAGEFCRYVDLHWYQRQYWMALAINVVMVLVCAVLAALLVQEKAARGPVPIEAEEKSSLMKEILGAKSYANVMTRERDAHMKREQDLMSERTIYQAEIKRLNNELALKTARLGGLATRIDSAVVAGEKVSELNKEMAAKMSTSQGVVLEAKRILGPLGVRTVKVVEP